VIYLQELITGSGWSKVQVGKGGTVQPRNCRYDLLTQKEEVKPLSKFSSLTSELTPYTITVLLASTAPWRVNLYFSKREAK
jgi:hypothetical protein